MNGRADIEIGVIEGRYLQQKARLEYVYYSNDYLRERTGLYHKYRKEVKAL